MAEWLIWVLLIYVSVILLAILIAISRTADSEQNPYVNVNGQKVLFVEPEKEQWMSLLSSGLDALKPNENVLDYGFAKHYRRVYDRSLQSHITKTDYGVHILTNSRWIFLQRYRKQTFSNEYDYKIAGMIGIGLIQHATSDDRMLRIGTLKTPYGRKIEIIDVELESPELASIMCKQIRELINQYQAVKRLEKIQKKKGEIVMVPLKCPKCNGELQPTLRKDIYECKFCGATIMIKS